MEWPAWALDAWVTARPYIDRLAVWRGYEQDLQTLLIYAVGIALYTALVFHFYQNISRRDAFHSKPKPGWWGKIVHFLESAFIFPMMSFLYFGLLALALFLLGKSPTTYELLLTAMAVIVGVRFTAYISTGMSVDLAKLVPLGLLGVMLVDPGHLSLETTMTRVSEAAAMTPLLARFFLLFILLEGVMTFLRGSWKRYVRWAEGRRERHRYAPLPPKSIHPRMPHTATRRLEVHTPLDESPRRRV